MGLPPRRFLVPASLGGRRLDQALAELMPEYSRSRIQSWIEAGRVTVEGARARAKQKVWPGTHIDVAPLLHPSEVQAEPEAMALPIVYEDTTLLVLDKPAGLVVHPGSGNWRGTLMNVLLHHAPELAQVPRAGIVHRLDKDTSGLMVVAKTVQAQTDLVRQLAARSVRRVYLAIVEGRLTEGGTVQAPIGRHPRERTKMAVVERGKPAVTHYRVLEILPRHTLVECRLETGRTHQIRVHMQALGHPLVGDPVYGSRQGRSLFQRQALHATELALIHPASREPMRWRAPLPADLVQLLSRLRAS
ncbi:23S rRNA pseudouridine(1911/1915/1917) synthase RluD [Thiobacter aerophilum]|uniref:Pseudouridine synthase n=1 Tax=Thiobacter aerophilum TaxID=3121275 RepID=A0ABV0EFQ9_9BURK